MLYLRNYGSNMVKIVRYLVVDTRCKCFIQCLTDEENPVKQFVTGSHDETALLWQWNQEKNSVDCVHSCHGHAGSVDCVAVDPSSTRVSAQMCGGILFEHCLHFPINEVLLFIYIQ